MGYDDGYRAPRPEAAGVVVGISSNTVALTGPWGYSRVISERGRRKMFQLVKVNDSDKAETVEIGHDADLLRAVAQDLRAELPTGSSTFYRVESTR